MYSVICVYMWIFLFLQLHIWIYVWMCVGGQKLTWVLFFRLYESNFFRSLSMAWNLPNRKDCWLASSSDLPFFASLELGLKGCITTHGVFLNICPHTCKINILLANVFSNLSQGSSIFVYEYEFYSPYFCLQKK